MDGIERLTSYRQVGEMPLFVFAGIAKDDYLVEWRRHIWQYSFGTIIFGVVVMGFGVHQRRAQRQIHQHAYFDTLTGLPNRRMLSDRLNMALVQAKRYKRSLALMFLDLDGFKTINDKLGHDMGDELISEVAARLKTSVRSGDTIARQGGDEFVIVLAEISKPQDAALVAEKIKAVLVEPIHLGNHELSITTSIGIAIYTIDCDDAALELMKKADKAMYAAKAAGRDSYRFFE